MLIRPTQLKYSRYCNRICILLACIPAIALSNTLTVGPGKMFGTPCQAFKAAANGDEIDIDGSIKYVGDVCAIYPSNLTIKGVNGRPQIDAAGLNASGKGTWVLEGSQTVIENVELLGAKVADHNGAGIRLDGVGLIVRGSFIHDNEDGILTNNDGGSNILIENTEFGHNGYGTGQTHNIYVGLVNSLIFRFNYSHDANVGHDLKSRARTNTITYNRFSSTPPGQTGSTASGQPSYEIDLPSGGTSYVIGNVIEQPAANQNYILLSYGEEGVSNPTDDLYVVNNTFLNDDLTQGLFVKIGTQVKTAAVIQNNVFAGVGSVTNQTTAIQKTNYQSKQPAFVNRAGYNLTPAAGAPFINAGTTPGLSAEGVALSPTMEYVHVASEVNRPIVGTIDIGAYEAPAQQATQ